MIKALVVVDYNYDDMILKCRASVKTKSGNTYNQDHEFYEKPEEFIPNPLMFQALKEKVIKSGEEPLEPEKLDFVKWQWGIEL